MCPEKYLHTFTGLPGTCLQIPIHYAKYMYVKLPLPANHNNLPSK